MTNNSKKIIFLLPVWGGGGGERVVSDLSFNLPGSIKKIIVVFESKGYYPYNGKLISLNLSVSTNLIVKLFNFIKGYFRFKKIVFMEKPDYVISFGSLQNIINLLAFKKSIIRVDNPIAISHQKFTERLYPLFVRLFFNKAHKIIVVSEGLKGELMEKFKIKEKNIYVIYNSIDIAKVQKLAREELEPIYQDIFSNPVIINIGSLIGQKGQEYLIRAFALLKDKIQDAKLVIIGEGPLERKLKGIAKDLGLEKDVHFLGWQKNPFKFIARSTVFAFPSLWEGFGIVILEAMACGVPVVAYDCPFGPNEILAPELTLDASFGDIFYADSGILLALPRKKNSAMYHNDNLAKAVTSLLSDENMRRRIIESAYQRVTYFSKKSFLRSYQFLWE